MHEELHRMGHVIGCANTAYGKPGENAFRLGSAWRVILAEQRCLDGPRMASGCTV